MPWWKEALYKAPLVFLAIEGGKRLLFDAWPDLGRIGALFASTGLTLMFMQIYARAFPTRMRVFLVEQKPVYEKWPRPYEPDN